MNDNLAKIFHPEPTEVVSIQLWRSLVVSVIALIVDFGGLVILKQKVGLNYLLAAAISFCLGVLVNYYLSNKWVFALRRVESRHKEFTIFFGITFLGLVFNLLIIAGMVDLFMVDYRAGKGVSTIIVFFWNFLARKKFLY